MNSRVVGVDIGGSHITAALVDLKRKQIVKETVCRRTIDSNGSLEEIISNWSGTISQCIQSAGLENVYIGIAMPGPFDYEEGICHIKEQAKYKSLYGINVKNALAAELNILSDNIEFINDAASFLKGEVFAGAAQNCKTVFGFTLGTGFGSSFCEGDELEDANMWCRPFKDGIAEDHFSTRWFVSQYSERTLQQVNGVKELAERYNEEEIVRELFSEFGINLADFIAEISKDKKPEMIVLGGNIAKSFQCFKSALNDRLNKHDLDVRIEQSILNESAILFGSASCWLQKNAIVK